MKPNLWSLQMGLFMQQYITIKYPISCQFIYSIITFVFFIFHFKIVSCFHVTSNTVCFFSLHFLSRMFMGGLGRGRGLKASALCLKQWSRYYLEKPYHVHFYSRRIWQLQRHELTQVICIIWMENPKNEAHGSMLNIWTHAKFLALNIDITFKLKLPT